MKTNLIPVEQVFAHLDQQDKSKFLDLVMELYDLKHEASSLENELAINSKHKEILDICSKYNLCTAGSWNSAIRLLIQSGSIVIPINPMPLEPKIKMSWDELNDLLRLIEPSNPAFHNICNQVHDWLKAKEDYEALLKKS